MSIGMDCLPVGPDGRPSNAARDLAIQNTTSIIPNSFMPALTGWALTQFASHTVGFRWFFFIGGCVSMISTCMMWFTVHPLDEPLDKPFQCTRHCFASRRIYDAMRREKIEEKQRTEGVSAAVVHNARVSVGAQLCDRLLFGTEGEKTRMLRVAEVDTPLLRGTSAIQ